MLNDRSSLLSFLETRRSGKPREMIAPGPTSDELDRILAIAARVPDHGKLAPWRFLVIGKEKRDAFALLLRRALAAEDPCATPAHHEAADEFAHQGEALVVLISAPVLPHKIPQWEQELSCGAVAMNLLTATHALGYVGGWLTGWQTYSPMVNAELCEPGQKIAGFLFLGSPGRPLEERPRPPLNTIKREWTSQG